MSDLLNRLGYLQTRRDRTPNLDLARDLVARDDTAGIREIAENMWNDNKNIHADCMNVMYEIGSIDPNLITPYAEDFIKFLKSKHHNMVQGAITALAEIAKVKPDFIFKHLDEIKKVKETGSDTLPLINPFPRWHILPPQMKSTARSFSLICSSIYYPVITRKCLNMQREYCLL